MQNSELFCELESHHRDIHGNHMMGTGLRDTSHVGFSWTHNHNGSCSSPIGD
jgi:hypothetical protein